MIDIDKLNPFSSFRSHQKDTITKLLENVYDGAKIIELNSATGTGKSLMLTVLCRALMESGDFGNAIYTSPQRILVSQLANDEKLGIVSLLGRGNYACERAKSGFAGDCPVPAKLRRKTCANCPYLLQKDRFLAADLGATTLPKILVDKSIPRPRILVIDECQGLEKSLIEQSEIEIPDAVDILDLVESSKAWVRRIEMEILKTETKLEKIFSGQLIEKPREIRKTTLADEFTKHIEKAAGFFDQEAATKAAKELVRYNRICEKARGVLRMAEEAPDSFIITRDRTFRMMDGRQAFQDLILNTELVILASGTPNSQLLATDYATVLAPHPIPIENRHVFFDPCGRMSVSEREATLEKMGPKVAAMHKEHGQNTLCHCHSYKIADVLGNILYDEGCRPMFTEKENREEGIEAWKAETGRILLSVGCEEGLDLPGEKNFLNVIIKCPFQYLGDEWVVRRNEMDKPLPNVQRFGEVATATAIQQACGRMVRGPNDLGPGGKPKISVIMDSSFEFFYKKNWQCFQVWFRESLRRR